MVSQSKYLKMMDVTLMWFRDSFVKRNKGLFDTVKTDVQVKYSQEGNTEDASELILNGTLKLGSHGYTSNWLVASSRYDVLLGMPWHVANNPEIDYSNRVVKVGSDVFPVDFREEENVPRVEVTNLGVKSFRRMVKRKGNRNDFQVFQLVQVNSFLKSISNESGRSKVEQTLKKYDELLTEELPDGLPPQRAADHQIDTGTDSKPPHRPLFQLSPAELEAANEYVETLLKKGKIRPIKSPCGASLFFVKDKNKPLRGVVDYRARNRIMKRNNAPLPRSDEMFDRLGGTKFFSKLDMKTGFHQIGVRHEDIEKSAFNTKYGQFEYLVMPMGLCDAPATFQTLMNQIFYDGINVLMVVYMDDLLIFSRDENSHLEHLEIVLSRLR